jgi:hypothetical protein
MLDFTYWDTLLAKLTPQVFMTKADPIGGTWAKANPVRMWEVQAD